jgi:hypothetical protein
MIDSIDRMRQELIKARILRNIALPHRHSDMADMAEASRRGRLLQSEPEKPLPADVPLRERGFGVMDEDVP